MTKAWLILTSDMTRQDKQKLSNSLLKPKKVESPFKRKVARARV